MFQLSEVVFVISSLFVSTHSQADELQCDKSLYKCDNQCVTPCDGIIDCKDGADETTALCSQFTCSSDSVESGDIGNIGGFFESVSFQANKKFRCNYGGCIAETFKCNGRAHCWDGSDETAEVCATKKCRRLYFKCTYGGCIRRLWKCDGKADCIDGSDETEEECRHTAGCPDTKPDRCDYGACLRKGTYCNGVIECHDDSDETKVRCGANHTAIRRNEGLKVPEAETNPQSTTAAPTPAPPTPAPTPAPTPSPAPTPPSDPCLDDNQCTCPDSTICVPCERLHMCASLFEGPKCKLPPHVEDSGITVDVLVCGSQAIVNVAVFSRNAGVLCTKTEVPVETVVIADCWGAATLLAQCHEDGRWHAYGNDLEENTMEPTLQLCQFASLNSRICGRRPRYRRPILGGGSFNPKQQWPWLTAIYRNLTYACTGSVISPDYVLTAAHCITKSEESTKIVDRRELAVHYMSTKGHVKSTYVTEAYIHPSYTGGRRPSKDVAIIKLEDPAVFSDKAVPACVNTHGFPDSRTAATFTRAPGGGNLWETILQKHDERCRTSMNRCTTLTIEDDQFCAIDIDGSRFLDRGDSGGPYITNMGTDVKERWTVDGIVSAASGVLNCRQPFTIFTKISDFWPWIDNCIHRKVCL